MWLELVALPFSRAKRASARDAVSRPHRWGRRWGGPAAERAACQRRRPPPLAAAAVSREPFRPPGRRTDQDRDRDSRPPARPSSRPSTCGMRAGFAGLEATIRGPASRAGRGKRSSFAREADEGASVRRPETGRASARRRGPRSRRRPGGCRLRAGSFISCSTASDLSAACRSSPRAFRIVDGFPFATRKRRAAAVPRPVFDALGSLDFSPRIDLREPGSRSLTMRERTPIGSCAAVLRFLVSCDRQPRESLE